MHSNNQFSDKSKHVAELSLIKDAAHISISHVLHISIDHKRISWKLQLQLWCCHGEGFGDGCAILWDRWDEMQRTSSSQAKGIFQCSPAHFTNFTLWMAWQIGYGNGPLCLLFLCSTKKQDKVASRFEQSKGRLSFQKLVLWHVFRDHVRQKTVFAISEMRDDSYKCRIHVRRGWY